MGAHPAADAARKRAAGHTVGSNLEGAGLARATEAKSAQPVPHAHGPARGEVANEATPRVGERRRHQWANHPAGPARASLVVAPGVAARRARSHEVDPARVEAPNQHVRLDCPRAFGRDRRRSRFGRRRENGRRDRRQCERPPNDAPEMRRPSAVKPAHSPSPGPYATPMCLLSGERSDSTLVRGPRQLDRVPRRLLRDPCATVTVMKSTSSGGSTSLAG
jgi:hypothetical protein